MTMRCKGIAFRFDKGAYQARAAAVYNGTTYTQHSWHKLVFLSRVLIRAALEHDLLNFSNIMLSHIKIYTLN